MFIIAFILALRLILRHLFLFLIWSFIIFPFYLFIHIGFKDFIEIKNIPSTDW